VYSPELEMDPPLADHVTVVLLNPATVAVNCCVPPVCIEVELGVTVIDTASAVRIGELATADVTPPQPQFTTATARLTNRKNNEVTDERRIPTPLLAAPLHNRSVEHFYEDS
jgi:hypothetical protein